MLGWFSIQLEEFHAEFVSIGRPVVVRQATLGTFGARAELRRRWSLEGLAQVFGDRSFEVGEVPKPKSFAGISAQTMTLQEFVTAHLCPDCGGDRPVYIFDGISSAVRLQSICCVPLPRLRSDLCWCERCLSAVLCGRLKPTP